jgi:undecaprenyl-diphosphatase
VNDPGDGFGELAGRRLPHVDIDAVPGVAGFDAAAERLLDRLRGHPAADRVFYLASEAGNFSLIWHALAWTEAAIVRSPASVRRAAEVSVALGLESALVNGGIKALFARNRPLHDADRPHRLRTPKTSSFPSGHASAAVVAWSLLSRRPSLRGPVGLAAVVVALSRAYVRIHHASDVVGGAVAGLLLGRIARRLLR